MDLEANSILARQFFYIPHIVRLAKLQRGKILHNAAIHGCSRAQRLASNLDGSKAATQRSYVRSCPDVHVPVIASQMKYR